MSAQSTKRLFVVGGSGFLGQAVCKRALLRGWRVTSLSRSGKPSALQQAPQTPQALQQSNWADEVEWVQGDSLRPETYQSHLAGCSAVVHTVGTLLEANYKPFVRGTAATPFDAICSALKHNPLKPSSDKQSIQHQQQQQPPQQQQQHEQDTITYNRVNRDTALAVARTAAHSGTVRTFVYISATDAFPVVVPHGYISSKREAEQRLREDYPDLRTVSLRPGFMFSKSRPFSVPLAGAMGVMGSLLFKPLGALVGSRTMVGDAMIKLATPPLHIDTVADAALNAIADPDAPHVLEVDDILRITAASR